MSVLKKSIQIFITSLLAFSTLLSAQIPVPEYQVKAVFLFNFTMFVEWDSASFDSQQAPFVIGILGENPFNSYLEDAVKGEKVKGHPVVVNQYKNIEEITTCHILFINKAEINYPGNNLLSLKGKNILTVSDAPDFLQQGGMIRFYTKNTKVRFQINRDAAKAAKLDISSKLLSLAEIFVPK